MEKVLVIGSSNIDYALSVDHFPKPGETLMGKGLKINFGGKGANQAVALRRSGIDVSFLTPLGKDQHAQDFLEHLQQEGVDTSHVFQYETHTGLAFIAIDQHAENTIIVEAGSNYAIKPQDLSAIEDFFDDFTMCLMQLELPFEVVKEALSICHQKGITTILNPAPYHPSLTMDDLKMIDYFIPNEHEFESFFKGQKVDEILANTSTKIIVTQGKKGSLYLNERYHQEAIAVGPVDTTGAGDTYVGYFVGALARKWSIKEAMRYASYASALAVTRLGAQDAIPYHGEVMEFMKANK